MKSILFFLVFLFGVMAGYSWHTYHVGLSISHLKGEVAQNRQLIDTLQKEIELQDEVLRIIKCESGGRITAIGDGGKSYGLAQFKERTFSWMKIAAGEPKIEWHNPEHQVRLLKWALANGYGKHWVCYKK